MDAYPKLLQDHGRQLAILEYSHEYIHSVVVGYALEGADTLQVPLHELRDDATRVHMSHGDEEQVVAKGQGIMDRGRVCGQARARGREGKLRGCVLLLQQGQGGRTVGGDVEKRRGRGWGAGGKRGAELAIASGLKHTNIHLADADLCQRRNSAARFDHVRGSSAHSTLALLARGWRHRNLLTRRRKQFDVVRNHQNR